MGPFMEDMSSMDAMPAILSGWLVMRPAFTAQAGGVIIGPMIKPIIAAIDNRRASISFSFTPRA